MNGDERIDSYYSVSRAELMDENGRLWWAAMSREFIYRLSVGRWNLFGS